ncbi:tetratricopeptide repeat protein [Tardiphaga sp. vice352]|uniref:tetratricopeptide repeat protein n=1 Tax=unclassified Tardiphaga TaxID=2631404 RepID=UPI001164FAD5|nr:MULTISPECIES: tetratricopeptide repeat protein [unclassified Tardiphaga]MBC7586292.1 tetratricopeptide repeat protein [Tardiphaga sp.]QDM17000.1 tetratricopeptide repeat protein [Tardiphaga sp. vice278]QDM21981.1 tetratricopeptide repeat protein [Tardiphaga sp. vice154]QDM27235.1 tetratricopeptide repeat protein [Tardiphaga sp. vice304]QDM32360.1 tetratricopeptide repeat protein [Tardiphaga sp. vice352]
MSELFSEVDEDLRRERLKRIWDRYSLLIIAVAVLIVGGVGGWRGYSYLEGKKAAEAGAAFDRAADLAEQNKHAEAEAAFTKLAAEAPSGYRTLARLRAAAEAAPRDPAAAIKMYDEIIADRAVSASEQDLARLRAAGLQIDTAPYDALLARLEPATAITGTYRHTARELLALSAWRANNAAATRQWLDMIANDAETPPTLRTRAEALAALLPPAAKS